MKKEIFKIRFWILTGLVLLAVLSRLIDHPANFSPVLAIALFGAAYYKDKKLAFIIPLAIMFISDVIIGLHPAIPGVYAAYAVAVLIGFYAFREKVSTGNVALSALSGSVMFFIITNFYVWAFDPFHLYQFSFAGLVTCFEMALPFFRNSLAGDLIYSAVLFGSYALAGRYLPVASTANIKN